MRTIIYFTSFLLLFISLKSFSDEQIETSYIPTAYCNKSLVENPRFKPDGIDVIYINGIKTSATGSLNDMIALKRKIVDVLVPSFSEKIQVMNIYNPSAANEGNENEGFAYDAQELRDQAQAEEKALEYANGYINDLKPKHPNLPSSFWDKLKKLKYNQQLKYIITRDFFNSKKYLKQDGSIQDVDGSNSENIGPTILKIVTAIEERVLSGRRVIVVAHSQGNLFTEAAYAILKTRLSPVQLSSLQFVGVAVVSHTTPSDKWLTISTDYAVYRAYPANTLDIDVSPLGYDNSPRGNFDAVAYYGNDNSSNSATYDNLSKWDPYARHSFTDIYLNEKVVLNEDHSVSILDRIRDLVKQALLQTTASTPVISLSPISATLSWVNAGHTDMDLHVIEWLDRNLQHVYYDNKMGVLGYLDLDDTNGPGPEHYFYNIDNSSSNICEPLYGKKLSFYVHPYTFNAEHTDEPVALNLKIGSSIYSKSILLKQSDRILQSPDGRLSGPHFFDVSFDYSGNYTVTTY